ncbi:hypothetical protein BLOT_014603 [Blomia tropicalis]|nr:hypothetical protein BLOT_014603 [Blomia tropicalis]
MTIKQIDQPYGNNKHDRSSDDDVNITENVGNLVNDGLIDKTLKRDQIQVYLKTNDKLSLKMAAMSEGGFISDDLRLRVWFKIAGVNWKLLPQLSDETIQNNGFYRQVILDVDRSLKRFPPSVHEAKRILYQDSLTKMIIRVLYHNPNLHYYQGYHDICLTFLLMMDEERAFNLVDRVSNTHLKYFMEETMNTTSNHLQIIYLILCREDPRLHNYLVRSEVGTIFCLSWVITWFSHVLNDFDDITRLFDCFISCHFLMPIYLTTSILLYKSEQIQYVDCDMASMHQFLAKLPEKERLPFDRLIMDTLHLSVKYPPYETLDQQNELHQKVFNDDPKPRIMYKVVNFFRKNVFSITFVVLVGALIFQMYTEYSYL